MKLTAIKAFEAIQTDLFKLNKQDVQHYIVAFSGGPDSTALLYLLSDFFSHSRNLITACHINHNLRSPKELEAEIEIVKLHCTRLSVPLRIFTAAPGELSEKSKIQKKSLEEVAREFRYGCFERLLDEKPGVVFLAHNRDDQSETLIQRFLQGGLYGLTGIPRKRERYFRPLLSVSKDDILDYLNSRGISYSFDSTNGQNEFLRNRIRNRILPQIREVFPSADNSLEQLSHRMEELYILARMGLESVPWSKGSECWSLDFSLARRLPEEYFVWSIMDFYWDMGRKGESEVSGQIPFRFFRGVAQRLKSGREGIVLRGYGIVLRIQKNRLLLERLREVRSCSFSFNLENIFLEKEVFSCGPLSLRAVKKDIGESVICIPETRITLPLVWRTPRPGDRIRLGGHGKSVKKIINEGQGRGESCFFSLLEDRKGVICVLSSTLIETKLYVSDRINYHFFGDFSDNFYYIDIIREQGS